MSTTERGTLADEKAKVKGRGKTLRGLEKTEETTEVKELNI